VHDEPTQEKVHNLQEFLKTLDLPFAKSGHCARRCSIACWRKSRRGSRTLVNEVVLRSQARRNIRPRITAISG